LSTLGKRFRHGFYFGVAFTFVDRTDAFAGAFESSSTVEPDEKQGQDEPAAPEKPGTKKEEKPDKKPLL
jgi:hypothetical protein